MQNDGDAQLKQGLKQVLEKSVEPPDNFTQSDLEVLAKAKEEGQKCLDDNFKNVKAPKVNINLRQNFTDDAL